MIAVARDKFRVGYPNEKNGKRWSETDFAILPLRSALERHYSTDAHCVGYLVDGAKTQPRITKGGAASYPGRIVLATMLADVDNAGHQPWSDEGIARLKATWSDPPHVLRTCGIYSTRGGYRLVQPLTTPIPIERAESHLDAWLDELEAAGIAVDRACRDWTRHFRMPHVVRAGGAS
jgi:hypothetical protein